MDEEYDYVVLGTGLVECVLSSLLSMEGKKVLHMDRNDYYGGELASLTISQGDVSPPEIYGRDRDWCIDLVPKFMMAAGELVKILTHTDVTRYLEFRQVEGSYVYRDGRISKVPASESEAIMSPLMGIFEKRRAKKFFEWLQNYQSDSVSTHQGFSDLNAVSMAEIFKKFGLEPGTQDFMGHALALHLSDNYINEPAKKTCNLILLYMKSMARYGKSPYLYPLYGLSELPQGFARLSAIHGGTYMLNTPIESIVYDSFGKVSGVLSDGKVARCKAVIGDPSYFQDKTRIVGRVIRAICLLTAPLPNTNDADSIQVVIPQRQVNRKTDIYIAMVGSGHNVSPKAFNVAIVSTVVETDNPENELLPAFNLLGKISEKFISISDLRVPLKDGRTDSVYISESYDATSHFETVCHDILSMYERVTGKKLIVRE